jgi:hypothetical protein
LEYFLVSLDTQRKKKEVNLAGHPMKEETSKSCWTHENDFCAMKIATQIEMPEIHCSNCFLVWNLFIFLHFFGVTDILNLTIVSTKCLQNLRQFYAGSSILQRFQQIWTWLLLMVLELFSQCPNLRKSENPSSTKTMLSEAMHWTMWVNNSHPHHHTWASLITIWDMDTTNSARYLEHVQQHL